MRTAHVGAVLALVTGSACTVLVGTSDIAGRGADASPPDARAPGDAGASPYVAAVLADEPVMYFRFEEHDGVVVHDETGEHPGRYFGAYTLGGDGILPGTRGVSFDGGRGGASIGDAIDLGGTQPVSVELWFQPSGYDTVHRLPFSIEREGPGAREAFGLVVTRGGGIGTERWVQGTGAFMVAPHPRPGTYHHVVATYDGATVRLFVDGLVVNTSVDVRSAAGGPYTVWVGAPGYGQEAILGVVDELAVYDKALDPRRVAAHFAAARQQ